MSTLRTEYKINVHVEPINGSTMDNFDFKCMLYIYTNLHNTIGFKVNNIVNV